MTTNDVPNEHMHCFNITDGIPKYEPMDIEREVSDLLGSPSLRKLSDFSGYQTSQKEANLKQQNETVELEHVSAKTENRVVKPKKKTQTKVRGPYRSYNPEQMQELLDLVIKHGLSARKAEFIVGIFERTAQHYVKQYKDNTEKRLSGQIKRTQRVGKFEPCHIEFLCSFFAKRPEAVLWLVDF
ncbi:hypothetical protein G6F46_008315 [Rhizopus delemar]|uniref:Uncharacterized protein n=2 Tax=Rhizopus TaxID=4842 RepID=A0A9P6YZG9_9FUNG|nr:hypothetical protein G6F55_009068 [Rhizopus delemar]KAG1540336.1 hypothetical protein G6F51_008584 [Rhizopus arrhizus]KAG1494652.1 hypothetical protein G6F54_007728 [Rhizopus delemar]KAG1506451.1 hypothetical protein G6F53_009678 [Rhizopus delemar]KAG1528975.1 hypothetical protein G6F52_000147 [Rhizopus delemar]